MYETQERAKRIADIHVLWGQSTVIEELIQAGKIDEEYLYPFNGDEVLEWWLVTPWLAERLKEQGEVIIEEYTVATGGADNPAGRLFTWTA